MKTIENLYLHFNSIIKRSMIELKWKTLSIREDYFVLIALRQNYTVTMLRYSNCLIWDFGYLPAAESDTYTCMSGPTPWHSTGKQRKSCQTYCVRDFLDLNSAENTTENVGT